MRMKNKKMFGGVPAVTEDLRRRIGQGDWKTGERMPSSRELAETYGVSLGTVSRAIAILKNEGLLSAASGSRAVLAAKKIPSGTRRAARLTASAEISAPSSCGLPPFAASAS